MEYPKLVKEFCYRYDAWIVGGAANPNTETIKDYDIIVPYSLWNEAKFLIPLDAKLNSFRGYKFEYEEDMYDVWCDEVGRIIVHPKCKYAYHLASDTLITKYNEN